MAGGDVMTTMFQSWLSPQFERYVLLKRAGGAVYSSQELFLAQLDRYLVSHAPSPPLCQKTLLKFLRSLDRLSPRGRDNVVSVVWNAIAFARRHGEAIEAPPPRPPSAPKDFRLHHPRFVSLEEMRTVIAAARLLPPAHSLNSATFATLFGLLFASGIRIGEALSLDIGDIDCDVGLLTVRKGKFGKDRVLPLKRSTVSALDRYIHDSRRSTGVAATAPLFVSSRHRRLSHPCAYQRFTRLCVEVGVTNPKPRLHDIRHSFSVLTLLRWYRKSRDLNVLLPALSTYLGHVSVENTRTYLAANGLLLDEACRRFSRHCAQLDEVLS